MLPFTLRSLSVATRQNKVCPMRNYIELAIDERKLSFFFQKKAKLISLFCLHFYILWELLFL